MSEKDRIILEEINREMLSLDVGRVPAEIVNFQERQSCGSATAATFLAFSGSLSLSHLNFVAVNEATSFEPVRV